MGSFCSPVLPALAGQPPSPSARGGWGRARVVCNGDWRGIPPRHALRLKLRDVPPNSSVTNALPRMGDSSRENRLLVGRTADHRRARPRRRLIEPPLPPKVAPRVADTLEILSPAAVHTDGWIGKRIDANTRQRLLPLDTEPLLAGYHHRPGSHPWIGEHVGKWMHAATLAWAYTGDPQLREKLNRAAAELVRCQEADGYLGTYVPAKRFGLYPGNDWDVWSHKYNLIGLLTYYQYTADTAALRDCRRMGDLLIATFPDKKSILAAGTHEGMAATSVLRTDRIALPCDGRQALSGFRPLYRPLVGRAGRPQGADDAAGAKNRSIKRPMARPTRCSQTSSACANCTTRATGDGKTP